MDRGILGLLAVAAVVFILVTHTKPAPKLDGASPAKLAAPKFHFIEEDQDVDKTIDIKDDTGSTVARLFERRGLLYDPKGSPHHTVVTPHLEFVRPAYDIGAFAGYRPASRHSTELDPFTAGLRFSPLRLGYGIVAPDLVITNQWAGAGASFYLPEGLAGVEWKHFGVGAWYGYPFRGQADAPGGWTVGLSFSVR